MNIGIKQYLYKTLNKVFNDYINGILCTLTITYSQLLSATGNTLGLTELGLGIEITHKTI